jgi:class 3 adenylate cyclase
MEAERRQVTVLFRDMVGFTSFSERSGEEAAFALMRSLSKLTDEAVRQRRPQACCAAGTHLYRIAMPAHIWT